MEAIYLDRLDYLRVLCALSGWDHDGAVALINRHGVALPPWEVEF